MLQQHCRKKTTHTNGVTHTHTHTHGVTHKQKTCSEEKNFNPLSDICRCIYVHTLQTTANTNKQNKHESFNQNAHVQLPCIRCLHCACRESNYYILYMDTTLCLKKSCAQYWYEVWQTNKYQISMSSFYQQMASAPPTLYEYVVLYLWHISE